MRYNISCFLFKDYKLWPLESLQCKKLCGAILASQIYLGYA